MKKEIVKHLPGVLFFGLFGGYLELLLNIADNGAVPSLLVICRLLAVGAAMGVGVRLIAMLIPSRKAAEITVGVLLFLLGALPMIYHGCDAFFGTYFQIGFMLNMTSQVAGTFMGEVFRVFFQNLWFLLLALVPLAVFVVFRKQILSNGRKRLREWPVAILLVICSIIAVLLCHIGDDKEYYTYNFNANDAVPRFGMATSIRLEAQYAIFGMPLPDIHYVPDPPSSGSGDSEDPDPDPEPEPPVVYEKNVTDIDWSSLSGNYSYLDNYFANQEPTTQNKYTGMFAGKNLIFITAEAFSTPVIDPQLTPTLYKLSHEGFVCSNFYQPGWGQSTTGGEFANMTGLLPNWINGKTAFMASVGNSMPMGMGWQFSALGYDTYAYHNNSYSYYGRDLTHPNMGYTYLGCGNGLVVDQSKGWPYSDLDMMQVTLPQHIQKYVDEGVPFHNYYMTVSGHGYYSWAHAISRKNREAVEYLNYPETIGAYLASQMELEYALQYTVDALQEAGILEDTVIVLAADHYPYAMTEGSPVDYYAQLSGVNDTEKDTSRYHNTLILWCGSMEETVYIDTPCSTIDLVPTLYNLFGIKYDSRLFAGKDILDDSVAPGEISTSMTIAAFPGKSWMTNAGVYEASVGHFVPFEGVEVSEDYAKTVSAIVADRWAVSRLVIEQDYYRHIYG